MLIACLLKPWMVHRRMVDHQVRDDTDAAVARGLRKLDEIPQCAIARVNAVVIANVITMVPARRRIERLQPDAVYVQSRQVIQLSRQTDKIANAVAVSVRE